MSKSIPTERNSKTVKPEKPYEGFPLFAHATNRWAKKIRGKLHYFGPWNDPDGALERLNHAWPFLKDGRTPPAIDTGEGCTVRHLCNAFLTSKKLQLDSDELSARSFRDYYATCDRLINHFGKDRRIDDLRPPDFAGLRSGMAKRWSVVTLKNEINRIRVVLKFAHDERLIDSPVHLGQSFNRPSAKVLRKARNDAGPRMFEADEIKRLLENVDVSFKAMILLAVNGGLGNTDIANLPQSAVDFENGWLDYPRPKTEIARRIPLWQETMQALRLAINTRPAEKDRADSPLCFLTRTGKRWVRLQDKKGVSDQSVATMPIDALSQRFKRLSTSLDINGHRGFYALRHTFETIAGESRDQVAVNAIMGHVDTSMAGVYRERISNDRLTAVVGVVHDWLWPVTEGGC